VTLAAIEPNSMNATIFQQYGINDVAKLADGIISRVGLFTDGVVSRSAIIANATIINAHFDRISANRVVIVDADIQNVGVNKLTANTATFTGDVVLQRSVGGGKITLNSTGVSIDQGFLNLTSGGFTTTISNVTQFLKQGGVMVNTSSLYGIYGYSGVFGYDSSGNALAQLNWSTATCQLVLSSLSGGYVQIDASTSGDRATVYLSGTNILELKAGSTPGVYINSTKVAGARQTGPGTAPNSDLTSLANWCNNLRTALQNYGCIT
jgi:hypothetical protein